MNTKTQNLNKQKKRSEFEILLSKAEESNPEIWNCMIDLKYDKESMSLELDQYVKCGQPKNTLYQIGQGILQINHFNFQGSLN